MKINKAFLIMLSIFLASGAFAADFRVDERAGNITIEEEKLENLHTAGNVVLINSNIGQDLLVGGKTITINNNVEDDLWSAGETIIVNGNIGGTARIGGSDIIIMGDIEEDLFVAGNTITITESSDIKGDLFIAANTVIIDGSVGGDIKVGGNSVSINGRVEGDIKGKVESLALGKDANIVGDLNYSGPKEAIITEGANIGGETNFVLKTYRVDKKISKKALLGLFTIWFLLKLVSFIVAGIVLVYLFKKLSEKLVDKTFSEFWKNLGIGFVALILVPVIAGILLTTLVGIYLSGILFITYILTLFVACLLATVSLGSLIIKKLGKKDKYTATWLSVIVGVILMSIIVLIPILGKIFFLIFMLSSLGVIYRSILKR